MYQKFIINQNGMLKFGRVYQHRELLEWGEECPYGGGLWKYDEVIKAILIYGRSFAFGPPCFEHIRHICFSGTGLTPCPVFFLPHWPSREGMFLIKASSDMS